MMSETENIEENGNENQHREILTRLDRIESLLMLSQLDRMEGDEAFEGVGVEQLTGGLGGTAGLEELSAAPGVEAADVAALVTLSQAHRFERFIDDLGFEFFRGHEFTPYWSRMRGGVRNSVPPESVWSNIVPTLAVLDRFRREIGSPVIMISTYRSVAYNRAIGGAGQSFHTQFQAIDFTCHRGTPREWANRLDRYRGDRFRNPETGAEFRFRGGIGVYPSRFFVHIDTRGSDANWSG